MSELTPCNYCTYNRIKRREERVGNAVILEGHDLYVVPTGDKLDKKKHHVAWFMELTDYCCC